MSALMGKPLCLINTEFRDIKDVFNKYRSRSAKVVCKNGVLYSSAKFTRIIYVGVSNLKSSRLLAD